MLSQSAHIHALLTERDPVAGSLITVAELEAMRQQAREQMPEASSHTIQDLVLVKALEVIAERMFGETKGN